MGPSKPEDWPRVFEAHLNDGDLDGALALYDSNASFVPRSGETIVGRDGIRQVLAEMIRAHARMQCRVTKVVTSGDVALVYNDWQGSSVASSGAAVAMSGKAIEILRRQADGTWLLIVGDPFGRG